MTKKHIGLATVAMIVGFGIWLMYIVEPSVVSP